MGCNSSKELVSSDNLSAAVPVTLPIHLYRTEHSLINQGENEQRAQPQDMIQNYLLLWLDDNFDESNADFCDSITRLQQTIDTIEKFPDADACLSYISNFKNEKAFLIVSGALTEYVVPRTHGVPQIYAIYIFCHKESKYQKWRTSEWPKIKGIFTEIDSVCDSIRNAARECDADAVTITGELESSFMYTTLFKDIVLEIDFDLTKTVPELADYARKKKAYSGNQTQLELINKFAEEYLGNIKNQPVTWYAEECFTYKILNKALGTLDTETLLKTGFYMRDLHRNIEELHVTQFHGKNIKEEMTVFRGQLMTPPDFKMKINKHQLLSFNNFLSTSEKRTVALDFIQLKKLSDNTKVSILFVISIDASIKSAPFARIAEFSKLAGEKEILFSTHTVFRVNQVQLIKEQDFIIQEVKLTLANINEDMQTRKLVEYLKVEIIGDGWQRMGCLLCKMSRNDEAEKVCRTLLQEAMTKTDQAHCYNQLGLIKTNKGLYQDALETFMLAIDIYEKTSPENDPSLATSYNNTGQVYTKMGEYAKAFEYYVKALKIYREAPSENHRDLATCYSNIGQVYNNMNDYTKAFEYYEKALIIYREVLPDNHPDLATSYNNAAQVYSSKGDYTKAREYYEKGLQIIKRALPENHPNLATSHNNVGQMYNNMDDYTKALEHYDKTLQIRNICLPENHPDLATSYSNIGQVYNKMGEYAKALDYHEKAFIIYREAPPENHCDFATCYSNIGQVYNNMKDYTKALEYYEKALIIYREAPPENHRDLIACYSNIGALYFDMGDRVKSEEYLETSYKIENITLPENQPSLATLYSNIDQVYSYMGDYAKVLAYCEQDLQITRIALPKNHLFLATSYSMIGQVYSNMGDFIKGLEYHQKAVDIYCVLPDNHLELATSYGKIAQVYNNMKDYTKALEYYEKALIIYREVLLGNHPYLATCYSNIGQVYNNMKDYTKALEYYEKNLEILQIAPSENRSLLTETYRNIADVSLKTGDLIKAGAYFNKAMNILPLYEDNPISTRINTLIDQLHNAIEKQTDLSLDEEDKSIC